MTDPNNQLRLRRINLNLLQSLFAILHSETLTQAAETISLTQPAISQALKKLRAEFDDELFYLEGGERRLTPLGQALKPRVEHALQAARETFELRLEFDPATSDRDFTIAAPESVLATFLEPLTAVFRAEAPNARISCLKLDNKQQSGPLDYNLDLSIKHCIKNQSEERLLYYEYLVCLAWKDSHKYGTEISLKELEFADLVGGEGAQLPEFLMRKNIRDIIQERGFVIKTDSLASLPGILIDTDLIALVPSWLAHKFAYNYPLRIVCFPKTVDIRFSVVVECPIRHAGDPAIAWLIDQLATIACNHTGLAPGAQQDQ